PVQGGVGIGAAHALDKRRDDVVVLVALVAQGAGVERGLGIGERDLLVGTTLVGEGHRHFQRVVRRAGVTLGLVGQVDAAVVFRTSFTPAVTADMVTNSLLVARAISMASVVLPVPGGPHRITDDSRSASIRLRSGLPGASSFSCPTTSSSVSGRIRAARGA